jgi:hypothetical protein
MIGGECTRGFILDIAKLLVSHCYLRQDGNTSANVLRVTCGDHPLSYKIVFNTIEPIWLKAEKRLVVRVQEPS